MLETTTAWQEEPGSGLHWNTMAALVCKPRMIEAEQGKWEVVFTVLRCACCKGQWGKGALAPAGTGGGVTGELYLEGGAGVLPLFWAICMLDVQLQHLVVQQL